MRVGYPLVGEAETVAGIASPSDYSGEAVGCNAVRVDLFIRQ